jgi:cyclophilin family peptidyl-prolyl cis-trans isomerase
MQNFLALAASGAYDGSIFHRNIAHFIIQVDTASRAWQQQQPLQGRGASDCVSCVLCVRAVM